MPFDMSNQNQDSAKAFANYALKSTNDQNSPFYSPKISNPSQPITTTKSAYQSNLFQPTEQKPMTTRDAWAKLYDLAQTDREQANVYANQFLQIMYDPSSPFYDPYQNHTNRAVDNLAALGIDTSNINDQWFQETSWLANYLVYNGTTNTPSSPGKKATKEQKAAYEWYQIGKANDTTKKAQEEWAALQEEARYMANDQYHNYSPDQIIEKIYGNDGAEFKKKYPTLAAMDASKQPGGAVVELNSTIGYSKDALYGSMWAAKNNGGTGNSMLDMIMSASGQGNRWTGNPEISAKLNWNDEENYSPYSVGMTAGEEGRYFDVYEFTPEKIEEIRSTLDTSDATAVKMFDNIVSAEETTEKGEDEREKLMAKVDDWISKGFSAEKIMKKVDSFMSKNCPTLLAMDKSLKSSDQKLLPTTRAIDYKYEDLKRYVEGNANNFETSGAEETDMVLSRAGDMWQRKFSKQQIETDKTETAALMDYVAAVEDELTPEELAYMTNASSSYWGDMRDSWDELGDSLTDGQPVSKEFALAQMETADKKYTASAFKSAEIITDYENKQKQYDTASAKYEELSKQYGDQQYVGKQISDSNVIEASVNGKKVFLNMTVDPVTGGFNLSDAYYIDDIGRLVTSNNPRFKEYVGNSEEWNKFVEEETAKYNTYAENVNRVNREGIQETDEGKEGLQEMYAAQALMEDAKAYLDKNRTAYDEAVKAEQKARDEFSRSYQLLDEHGANTDGGQTHLAMFDFALQYGKTKPKEKFGYSDVNQLDKFIASDTEGNINIPEIMSAARESIKEVDEQIADRQFLLEYFGDEIPKNYRDNITAQIADLQWEKKDREYFLLQGNEDWDEMVAKGLEENRPNLEFIDFSGGSRLPEHWANMTKEEIDRYHYILGRDGKKAADEYYAHLNENEMLGKRTMDNFREWSQQLAKDNVVLANLFAIGTAPISSISSLMGMIYSAATGKSANNTSLMAFNTFANEVNQATVQQIQETFKDNPTAQKLVQGAYEIVYNRGRSAANAAFFGGLGAFNEFVGALPMAVSAMADKVMELKDDGATDAQAWLLGTVTLLCEAGTEAIELKHIKGAKELGLNNLTGIKDFLKQYPIAGLNEALGESLNDIIENFSDSIVMGDESEFNDRVWHYRTTMGMSKEDAEAMAWKDEIYNVMHTAIISFLSPGLDVFSFASGKAALYDHYRRQSKEYNMSIRDIRNNEQAKTRYAEQEAAQGERAENVPTLEYESQTREAVKERYARDRGKLDERVNSVPTLDVKRAERETTGAKENTKGYQTDMEILETAGQTTDPNAKSSAMASVLKTGNTPADADIANTAATNINNTFKNGMGEVQDLLQGGMVAGVDSISLKKGIQYAILGGKDSACNQLVNSDEYKNATPDAKAQMLADAAALDEHNRKMQDSVIGAVRENLIAEQEAILGRDRKTNEAVTNAEETLSKKETELQDAQNDLDAKYNEMKAINDSLNAALQEQANNPNDDNINKTIESIIASIPRKNEEIKEYEQRLENKRAEAEKARTDLENIRRENIANNRKQAEAIVNQKYQDRAIIEQQRAEQAKKDAEIAEQARKDAQELSNFSRLNAEELVDQQFPNISREDRARAIRIYMAVQAAMSSNVQSVQARKDFTEKLAKKYGLTVKEVPQQGNLFNAHIDPKTRTLYVNERTNQSDVMYAILIHEITHPAENAKELYTELADAVLQMKYGDGITYNGILAAMQNGDLTSRLAQDILGKKRIYDNALKKNHSYEEALQEIVADGVGYVIAGDQKAIDQIVAEKPNLARRILATIKNFISRMAGLEGETVSQAQKIADMLEKSLEATWGGEQKNSISTVQPLVEDNDGNVLAEELRGGTVAIDTDRFSLNSFDAEERMRVADALRNAVDENGNRQFTEEEIYNYMSDAIGIASMIAADRLRLDFDADETKSMVKPNADYGISLDASTLCAKRLLYQGTFDEIQHLLPNTPLTPDDLIELANMMREMGYETPCGICYVESRRKTLGIETQKWLDSYTGDPEDSYIPKIEDLTTSDGLDRLSKEHPITHDNYLEAMKKLNQRNPKVVQLRTDYRGEIKEMSETAVQKAINHGGVRVQSFSDFETPHLLDMIQVVYDMASRGLTSQAYTKVPNFAWAFGDTGMKINLSEIAKGDGYEIAGGLSFKEIASMPYEEAKKLIHLLYDDVEGMKHSEAIALRNRYSKNVGTILVGKSDAHIIAAMADGEVDFIIPFHRSGWTKKERNLMETLRGYQDYTNDQNERKILMRKPNGKGYKTIPAAKSRIHNFEPVGEKTANGNGMNGYWDFSKSGRENAETYLLMCSDDKRIPKFSRFLVDNGDGSFSLPQGDDFRSTAIREGYWKTLIDFKMYDNDGNGSEQTAVTPNVNMPKTIRILNEYSLDRNGIKRENNNTNPVATPVVERFVEARKAREARNAKNYEAKMEQLGSRYSLPSDAPYLSAVNHGDMEEAQRMVEEAAKKAFPNSVLIQDGKFRKMWHHTNAEFTEFLPGTSPDPNGIKGIFFTPSEHGNISSRLGKNHKSVFLNVENLKFSSGVKADEEYADELRRRQEGVTDREEIARINREFSDETGVDAFFDWMNGWYTILKPENIKSADPVTYDDNGEVIPLSERFNDQEKEYRYSLPSDDILEEQFRYAIENGGDIPTITQNINPAQDEKERQWGRKGLQQSDEIAEQAKQYVLANNKYYPDTNSEQIDRAIEWIRSQRSERDPDGYNTAFRKVTSPNFNYRSADGQAQIIAMMGMAVARGDIPGQVQLADTYNKQGTVLGQALQARKLWKLMTPEGRIGSLQKMLDNAQDELTKRGINMDLTFSNWVYMAATAATEDGDMQRVYQMAGQELAKQIPANWRDKLRSIRMLSMLGNPRTHIRNIVGNALFVPAVGLKNKLGALMELGKKPGERTKTTSMFLSNEARTFAQQDAIHMKDELTGEAKYNEMNAYQKEQKAFKGLLQAVIDYNSNKLEAEDWKFLRGHYIRALGGWMMANGYTAEQLNNDAVLLEKGRSYAIQEAQKATYRDFSKMAATLNEVSRKGGAAGFIVDAVLPFKKTPANILKRGIEYSPIGLMRSLTTDLYRMKQWNDAQDGKLAGIPEKALSPTQWIDKLCSGLSGTAIMGIGALLSSMGLVTCGLTDDDDEIEKDKGAQQYAIKILGTDITYTMDWAAPMSMPFFVGAAVHEQLHSEKGFNVEDIVDALGNISEPVFNLSMLDGVNTLFKTSQYDDTNTITQIGAKVGSNYVTSYVPSLFGAITRIFADDTRRKAYVESDKGKGVLGTIRYAWEQTENKLPVLSQTNIPYRDVWGNPEKSQSFGEGNILGFAERFIENFISPGYISRTKNDPILNEMGRLYDSTHDSAMIPSDPKKSFKYNNENYVLTDKQWDAYKVARGQAAFNGLTELMSMPDYRNAEDDVQVQMIKEVWSYADQAGKAAIVPNYVMENIGENPISSIANTSKISGYENRMIQALNLGDYEAYETMIEALHEAEVEDSAIKTKIGNTYRTKYQKAYINDDFATMAEIEEILDNTDFDFDLDSWEEKAEEKYSR